MKAKASGTPAKLEATPLKVISVGRTQRGRPPLQRREREPEAEERAERGRGGADLEAQSSRRDGSTAGRAARCWRG